MDSSICSRFGKVEIKPPADRAAWVGSLDLVDVDVLADGEWLPDCWSPLWLAMELGDTDAFRALLEGAYRTHAAWASGHTIHVTTTALAIESSDENLVGALWPCLECASTNAAAEQFLAAVGVSGTIHVAIEPAKIDGMGEQERRLLAATLRRLGWHLALVLPPTPPPASAAVARDIGVLPTHTAVVIALADMLDGDIAPVFADACRVLGGGSEQAPAACVTRLADLASVRASLWGSGAEPLSAASQERLDHVLAAASTPGWGYALASLTASESLSGPRLRQCLERLCALEGRLPWFTGPTPSVNAAAHENRLGDGAAKIPPSRPAVLQALLHPGGDALGKEAAVIWAEGFVQPAAARAFGPEWLTAPLIDDATADDEAQFSLEESRRAMAELYQWLTTTSSPADEDGEATADSTAAAALPLDQRFKRAVDGFAKVATKHPDEVKLKFYSLYKQATVGDVTGSRPWAIEFAARAKYDAWAARKGTAKDVAMLAYCESFEALQQ